MIYCRSGDSMNQVNEISMNDVKQLAKQASLYQILKQYDNSRMSVIIILISSMLMILANRSYDGQNVLAFILLKRQDIFVIGAILLASLLKPHLNDRGSDHKCADYFSRPLILVLFACFLIALCRMGYHF